MTELVTAEQWFESGRRVIYDTKHKAIVDEKKKGTTVSVFTRVIIPDHTNVEGLWLTILPGFPEGSYGFSRVESMLATQRNLNADLPRMVFDYIGQGNSEKPKEYQYSTIERANLVEALWKANGVKTTLVVTMDFSSLVLLELLVRQKNRENKGIKYPRMEHVLSINGGFFAEGHTYTGIANGTPLVRDRFGKVSSSAAQRSNMVFNKMIMPLYSNDYRRSKICRQEAKETQKAIRLHQGTRAMAQMTNFVDEHKQRAERWDFPMLYRSYCKDQGISFHLVYSEQDEFEQNQVALIQRRMKPYADKVQLEKIAGGHMANFEQAGVIVDRILQLAHRAKEVVEKPKRSWANTDAQASPTTSTYNGSSSYTGSMSWTSASPRSAEVDYGLGSSSSFGIGVAH
mmetsp:Transcript_22608/g.49353  ORF Transcript_22608/g.49353 Transcript_22608/m.49353 type:complete len:400 (+) Transcript_22608:98-1297(+)|eukprot:CAMPEP_0168744064 /NCGR_PEP_ID=MMETSP0724-20121128/13898_1 /TAXON_ID=265536 /ORGANISM="Amphiprora sp., Strain CCMP467" /LENGTH=399 /DNA_ID=CAMNT_0008791711 /DNA_START=23 /DNA_END=1222 /DNA_ORIENTATION=+